MTEGRHELQAEIERVLNLGRRMSGTASVLQRTEYRWTDTERQQFNRLCEWAKEAFDVADRLSALVTVEAHSQVREQADDTRVDTTGNSTDSRTASENEMKDATVTPNPKSYIPLKGLKEMAERLSELGDKVEGGIYLKSLGSELKSASRALVNHRLTLLAEHGRSNTALSETLPSAAPQEEP